MELTGDQFLKIRRIYRLSQKDVADLTGVSEAFICMVENGKRKLTPKVSTRLADKLDLNPAKVISLLEFYAQTEVIK
ncbi:MULTISPECIES: helix-turn-helix domain-containing protein [Bacillus]|uniref:helix-turn-helix domain-containing protein n=1 Tax=Bacillus TaxID=1386 RepID=UPI00165F8270|nr:MULTISPECIES: helix-turn-helix transcriptional regulator [Bacillus]MDH3117234.1 helix-turn-helix transcriptional regulator [Bacillus subtilis]MBD0405844.1 helix-turn-helix transcriptional regulator [Bacillus sp. 1021]MEC0313928.1 helix-turn-helix transcriptional regulator [Bacillus subtilis]MEC0360836.1 helix-turn-helix transcriptional regulator [Bacillus subtilis]MEC2018567.1 helix-turn-helix transcriptional regulator [Bacillus velezensis]